MDVTVVREWRVTVKGSGSGVTPRLAEVMTPCASFDQLIISEDNTTDSVNVEIEEDDDGIEESDSLLEAVRDICRFTHSPSALCSNQICP